MKTNLGCDCDTKLMDGSRRELLRRMAGGAIAAVATGAMAQPAAEATRPLTEAISPFRVTTPASAIEDARQRLRNTRWPEQETVNDWSQGVPLRKMRALVEYWSRGYDWHRVEKRLNAQPQFRTQVDGLGIHFLHIRSAHENALPILITHGWPGSVVEFLQVIGPLTNPTAHGGRAEDAFHVVLPSLPGFGYSDRPRSDGWDLARIARAWNTLMQRLGYSRWVAQGGDWGAGVTTALGHIRPPGLAAIHLNWQFVFPPQVPSSGLSGDELRAVAAANHFREHEYGYFLLQATRPQTVGYALIDSPVGQAAWIYEKFQAWTDNDGDVESVLSRDEMLDDISLYWLSQTAASSARIYWENNPASFAGGRLDLPVAVSVFPKEIFRAPRSWAEQSYPQLIYWNEVARGGHFAAFEQPTLFVEELRAAFRTLR